MTALLCRGVVGQHIVPLIVQEEICNGQPTELLSRSWPPVRRPVMTWFEGAAVSTEEVPADPPTTLAF